MRVLSFALAFFAADIVVEAGVCKPAVTTTAQSALTSSVESSATAVSNAVTETSVVSASSIETLTSSVTLAGTTSTELVSSATTELSTTTAEETPTTTTTDAGPSMTPGSIVGTGPVADLTLKGDGQRFTPLSFAPSDSTQTLIFSLVNNQLSVGNNNYLCMTYKDVGVLGPLVLCPFDNFSSAPLKCTQTSSGALACTAPNGSCNASGTCRRPNNAALFYQFYVDNNQAGYFGPPGDFAGFTALGLILAQ